MGNIVTSALVRARGPEPTDEWLGFTQLERQNSLEVNLETSILGSDPTGMLRCLFSLH